jgi:hypothetical protein
MLCMVSGCISFSQDIREMVITTLHVCNALKRTRNEVSEREQNHLGELRHQKIAATSLYVFLATHDPYSLL